jgi:hypothetical protein
MKAGVGHKKQMKKPNRKMLAEEEAEMDAWFNDPNHFSERRVIVLLMKNKELTEYFSKVVFPAWPRPLTPYGVREFKSRNKVPNKTTKQESDNLWKSSAAMTVLKKALAELRAAKKKSKAAVLPADSLPAQPELPLDTPDWVRVIRDDVARVLEIAQRMDRNFLSRLTPAAVDKIVAETPPHKPVV